MSDVSDAKITVFVEGTQVAFLHSIESVLETVKLKGVPDTIIVLECEHADFGGPLVKLEIRASKAHPGPSYTVWLPHHCVHMALDFSPLRAIGFTKK